MSQQTRMLSGGSRSVSGAPEKKELSTPYRNVTPYSVLGEIDRNNSHAWVGHSSQLACGGETGVQDTHVHMKEVLWLFSPGEIEKKHPRLLKIEASRYASAGETVMTDRTVLVTSDCPA